MAKSMSRRGFLTTGAAGVAGLALTGAADAAETTAGVRMESVAAQAAGNTPYAVPQLSFAATALEPYLNGITVQVHLEQVHRPAVRSLNNALASFPELHSLSVDDLIRNLNSLPQTLVPLVRRHGFIHSNHSLYWSLLSPNGGGEPVGNLSGAINATFGSFEALRDQIRRVAVNRVGVGWVWLTVTADRQLKLVVTGDENTPINNNERPVMALDIWEHAYFFTYQTRRNTYIDNLWNVINWQAAEDRFVAAMTA